MKKDDGNSRVLDIVLMSHNVPSQYIKECKINNVFYDKMRAGGQYGYNNRKQQNYIKRNH